MGPTDTMTAPAEAERLRAQISERRSELGRDLEALGDHVSPGRMVERRRAAMSERIHGMREKLMGAADETRESMSQRASSMAEAVGDAPDAAMHTTQGNPLAVGLVSFGIGLVAASLLPPSREERRLASRAEPALERAAGEVGSMARQEADELAPKARSAAQDLRDDASDAARVVRDRTQSDAKAVEDQVSSGARQVADQARR